MEQVQAQGSSAVAVAATPAAAEVVATMLEVHGLRAWVEAYATVYPSVDWVEGHRVRVTDDDREEALRVLSVLDTRDAVRLDEA